MSIVHSRLSVSLVVGTRYDRTRCSSTNKSKDLHGLTEAWRKERLRLQLCKSKLLASTIGGCSGKGLCSAGCNACGLRAGVCDQAPCQRPAAMSFEVSGQPAGTLIQPIEAEIIPVPDRMSFPKWQHWRKHAWCRPTKKKDGIARSTAEEVKLWKEVMEFFHDIKSDDEEDDEDEEEEDREKDESLELAPDVAGVPALPPIPATTPPATEALPAAAAKAAASSAVKKGAADAAPEGAAPPHRTSLISRDRSPFCR